MNLPEEIIDEATGLLSQEHHQASDYLKQLKSFVDEHEALRRALEEERQATAEKYARLDIEFAKREMDRRAQFEAELSRIISEFKTESEQAIQAVKDRITAARLKKEADTRAAELRRSAGVRLKKSAVAQSTEGKTETAASRESLIEEITEIHERDRVVIKSLGKEGVVEAISDGTFTVLIGSLRFRAKREELQLVKSAAPVGSKRVADLPRGVSATVDVDSGFNSEINVIGATVDEATDRVDKFLDEAFMAGVERARIVHGHGKGALRRAVAELLSGHPHVEKFHLAPANEGGQGATIVEMKK
jgi:DNA mismatch repair protein MutS2